MAPFAKRRRTQAGPTKRPSKAVGRQTPKNIFTSARVQDLEDSDSEALSDFENGSHLSPELSDKGSDSEDEPDSVIRPYSALLQSLNAVPSSSRQPARKKQKLSNGEIDRNKLAEAPGHDSDTAQQGEISEEEGVIAADGEEEVDSDDEAFDPDSDPFTAHLTGSREDSIARSIKEAKEALWKPRKLSSKDGWRTTFSGPGERDSHKLPVDLKAHTVTDLKLKQRIASRAEKSLPQLEGLHASIAGSLFNYRDILFCERSPRNAGAISSMINVHALNHVLKTRDRVLKDNLKLSKSELEDLEFRDQGFTRPKVLYMLPTRQACSRVVESIVSLYEPEQQENKKRFQDSFTQSDDQNLDDRPEDFRDLFSGNDDDMFRLGLKFTRKTVKFFAQFYNSDIIFASPLGLRMAIGAEGSKKQDFDFLSSIELAIIDHADAQLMQNWDHIEHAFTHMNLQPKEAHGCDFGRVRNWYLDGDAKYLRQTIITTSFNTPEINKLFTRSLCNIEGKVKISRDSYDGAISELGLQVHQTFTRFDSSAPSRDPDARFKHFTTTIVPNLDKASRGPGRGLGVLIFIPSYLDFVRVRNFLANDTAAQNISFGSISEYTSAPDTSRARSHFITGRHSVLLYTGRAHHFNRLRLRGSKKIIFYSLPENPIFYQEMGGQFLAKSISEGLVDPNDASIHVQFSKWDVLKLERVVGSARMNTMMNEKGGDTFDFL